MRLGTLYSDGNLCPFAHRVQIAAAELSADISVVFDGDIPAAVREATRPGSWPAFEPSDGGDLLHDSAKIVDYLIAASGAAGESYRSDPEILAKLDTLVMCISKVILAGEPAIQKEFRNKLDRALAEVEFVRSANNGPFLEGEHFSQADGHIAPFLYRLPFLVEIRDHVPQIVLANDGFNAWVDRVVNRKSFQQIAPKRHAVRQFYAAKASYLNP